VIKKAKTLSKCGYEVTIVSLSTALKEKIESNRFRSIIVESLFNRIGSDGTNLKKSPRKGLKSVIGLLMNNLLLFNALLKVRADVYHADSFDVLIPTFIISKIRRSKLIYDIHDLFTKMNLYSNTYSRIFEFIESALSRKADVVLTVNKSLSNYLYKKYRIRAKVIMNCYNICASKSGKIQSTNKEKVIVYVGVLSSERSLNKLIDSAKYLRNAKVIIIGDGPLKTYLERQVIKLGLVDKVSLFPAVATNNLVKSIMGADIGVFFCGDYNNFSLVHSLPNKIFAYLSAGVALFVSDIPEIRRLVNREKCGIIINTLDPILIAEALNGISRTQVSEFKKNAKRAARLRYNWSTEGKLIKEIHRELLKT